MGITYTYYAVQWPPDGGSGESADDFHDENEGELFFDKGFGVLYELFFKTKDPRWMEGRRAFFGDAHDNYEEDPAAAFSPEDARRVASGLRNVPREDLLKAIWAEVEPLYRASEGVSPYAKEHYEECISDYDELIKFMDGAASKGHGVLFSVG